MTTKDDEEIGPDVSEDWGVPQDSRPLLVTNTATEIPDVLRGIAPTVGSIWMWEPLKPAASCKVLVTNVRWNGEAVWVESQVSNERPVWNELSRWVEATVLVDPGES